MNSLNNLEVKHDLQHQLFFIKLNNGAAHLKYEKPDHHIMDIKETYVPKDSRHKGIASQLVKYTLEYAQVQRKQVVPSCPFVEDFVEKNQDEYKDIIYLDKN